MPNDNTNLGHAQEVKNDEFYTQYYDIQKEVNLYLEYNPDVFRDKTVLLPCDDPEWSSFTKFFSLNFENFGIKKLISTSYARASKRAIYNITEDYHQMSLFELDSDIYDPELSDARGRIFTLERKQGKSSRININDLEWQYLDGDGDFLSDEVTRLRDASDIIITNPPYSLFNEFLDWILQANKSFLIIGNQNAATHKDIFSLIKSNQIWWGAGDCVRWFVIPDCIQMKYKINSDGERIAEGARSRWYTNIDHGRRHEPMTLMTMADNIKYSRHKEIKDVGYKKYDGYDAIDVPFVDAIPSDYEGIMGVPITFFDRYNPSQFEIIGLDRYTVPREHLVGGRVAIQGKPCYARVLIKKIF